MATGPLLVSRVEDLGGTEQGAWTRLTAVIELLPSALDLQLRRAAALTHFDYCVLAALSEAPDHVLSMTPLALRTNATLPRLSRVVGRLSDRGLLERSRRTQDARVTHVSLTEAGQRVLDAASPRHLAHVRARVFDRLTTTQVRQLIEITDELLAGLDPSGTIGDSCARHDPAEHLTDR